MAEELQKPIIKKIWKRKSFFFIKDNIWSADLADIQLISRSNKRTSLLYVTDSCSKYTSVVPLKDEKTITIVNTFQKVLSKSDHKPNKICVDKGSEFYNSSFKKNS